MDERASARNALRSALHLACVRGPDIGAVVSLGEPGVLGRHGSVELRAGGVSRLHAHIRPDLDSDQPPGAFIDDAGSANGTWVRTHRTGAVPRSWRRVDPHSSTPSVRIVAGDRVRVGSDVFEVRPRPLTLEWPEPDPPRRIGRAFLWLPAISVGGFALWRLASLAGPQATSLITAVVVALFLGGAVALGRRRRRDKDRWGRTDASGLALVLASTPPGRPGPSPSGVLQVWPSRPHPRNSLRIPIGPRHSASWGGDVLRGSPRESASRDVTCVGFVGSHASSAAWWWCAQIAARSGGATVWDSHVRVIGNGGITIHISSTDQCPHCSDQEADEQAMSVLHVATSHALAQTPTWCDHLVSAHTAIASQTWWEQVSTLLTRHSQGELPDLVHWDEYVIANALPHEDALSHRHTRHHLRAVIGQCADGTFEVDLVSDGPHALIAGTTGAGKSEVLTTLLMSLSTTYGPQALRFVLLDHKGGATLAPFAGLPHTECVLSDLDPAGTQRTLAGLEALVHARERDLAQLGLPDLARWIDSFDAGHGPPPPPRVLIVIDEFRALADAHPESLDVLVRLASQGRSMGLHLVAATQRPSGAITASMRANIDFRMALRCADAADSLDIIGSSQAAQLPRVPGRAIVRGRGEVQMAWVSDVTMALARTAAIWVSEDVPEPLWTPPLPTTLTWDDLEGFARCAPAEVGTGDALGIGLADSIDSPHPLALRWGGGHVRVEGPRHLASPIGAHVICLASAIALHTDTPIHAISTSPPPTSVAPRAASWVRPADSGSLAHLLESITDHGPAVLAIQDLEAALQSWEQSAGSGQGRPSWHAVLTRAQGHGITLVVGTPGASGSSHWESSAFRLRLLHASSIDDLGRAGLAPDPALLPSPGHVLAVGPGAPVPMTRPGPGLRTRPRPCVIPDHHTLKPRPFSGPPPWTVVPLAQALSRPTPTGHLGWAGETLTPFAPPSARSWVILGEDPTAAFDALEQLHEERGWVALVNEEEHPEEPDAPIVTHLPAHLWPHLQRYPTAAVIALDPDEACLRALASQSRRASPALRAEEFTERTGVILVDGHLKRFVVRKGAS